jgi:hypothetical protein
LLIPSFEEKANNLHSHFPAVATTMSEKHNDPPSGESSTVVEQQLKKQDTSPESAITSMVDNSFLSSMTFTKLSHDDIFCDCDECDFTTSTTTNGTGSGGSGGDNTIPATILQALHRYKRRKLETAPIRRTQCRTLVQRSFVNNVAIWHWTLPRGAEPLVELGNSHRIIWVQRLPSSSNTSSVIKAIGKGVLGSSHEEMNRTVMDWKQGGVYLVPANGGKAVGWIHEQEATTTTKVSSSLLQAANQSESSTSSSIVQSSSGGPVVLLIAKVPVSSLNVAATDGDDEKDGDTKDDWARRILNICSAALRQSENVTSPPPRLLGQSFQISETDAFVLKEIMSSSSA